MKWATLFCISIFCITVSDAGAAEKSRTLVQLDAARAAIEAAAWKTEGNKESAADLERAKTALKDADEIHKSGRSMFGFGDVSPETEKEIKLSVDMAELATATALSRVESVRAAAELEAIEKQYAAVSGRLKLFEERMAELRKLRAEAEAYRKTSNELEIIKIEKATLQSQVDQLTGERNRADKLKIEQLELSQKLEELKAENARLSAQPEKPTGIEAPPAVPVPEDPKKKAPKRP